MIPIGNYIKVAAPVHPEQDVIVERECLIKTIAIQISSDTELPFKEGAEVFIVSGKEVILQGETFIMTDYIFLHN